MKQTVKVFSVRPTKYTMERLTYLCKKTGEKRANIIRRAIEELYEKMADKKIPPEEGGK